MKIIAYICCYRYVKFTDMKLKIEIYLNPIDNKWWAYFEKNVNIVGKGKTKGDAIKDLLSKYGE